VSKFDASISGSGYSSVLSTGFWPASMRRAILNASTTPCPALWVKAIDSLPVCAQFASHAHEPSKPVMYGSSRPACSKA
jgi:hypothetical protein